MLFPDSFIDELKQRLPISTVIARKVPLKRYGTSLKGLCPFHQEKSPSFTVDDHKAMYYCFGCHASGDIIEFVTQTEKTSFSETVELLASLAGMSIPKLTPAEERRESQKLGLIEALAKTSEYYFKQLKLSSNHTALEYFQQRGINEKDIDDFALGYAPAKGLLPFLNKSGFSNELAVEAGLAIKNDSNNYVDRFRNRIIFPIKNQKNQIVGFGGRSLSSEIMPKYLNSPETVLFKKNNLLYAANIARKHALANERVIVVEGYMDSIFMHKAGFVETVATLGTAFNEKHLQLLWMLGSEPILCFDGDSAGKKAMLKAAHTALPLLDPGLTLKFCFLPNGKDPDEILHQHDKAFMDKLLDNSLSLADFLWQSELEKSKPNTPEGRALFEHQIYELVKQIKNQMVAGHYRQFMKDKLWQEFHQRKQKKHIITAHNSKLPLIADLTLQERFEYALFAQIIACPELIHDRAIFSDFSHFEIDHPELENLRNIITQYHECYSQNNETDLNNLILENNLVKLVDLLCGKESCFIDQISITNVETAKNNWVLTYKKYSLELLKTEYNQFIKKAYHDEEAFLKAAELKKSIDIIVQEITETENNL